MRRLVIPLVVLSLVVSAHPLARADDVEQRIADFWRRVDALGPADLLTAKDLGTWALNVIARDPSAAISVNDFRTSTAGMQSALERVSTGAPVTTTAEIEVRIAQFWQKVNALGPTDRLTAADLGQWALNVTDRDPTARIRVDDFRTSTASMQAAFDRARAAGVVESDRYAEDFTDGWADDWELPATYSVSDGALVAVSGRARYRFGDYWRDSTLRLRYQQISGEVRIHYRVRWTQQDIGYLVRGYEIALGQDRVSLSRIEDSAHGRDARLLASAPVAASAGWRTLQVGGEGRQLRVDIDGESLISHTDEDMAAVLEGSIGIHAPEGGQMRIDDIEVSASVHAEQTWVRTGGPLGTSVLAIAVDPMTSSTIYAGTGHSGLYLSQDRGSRWRQIGHAGGVIKTKVACVEIAPSDSRYVYLCHLEGGGASYSTDRGAHWTAVRPGHFGHVNAFAFHPQDARTAYVAIGSSEAPAHSRAEDGLYLTRDGGATWQQLSLGSRSLFAVRVARSQPSVVYAAGAEGVWRSDDAGTTWTSTSAGLGDGLIKALAVDPSDPLTVYARQSYWYGPLFKTTDGGTTWKRILDGVEGWTLSPTDRNGLYATSGGKVQRSRDGGGTWQEVTRTSLPGSVDALAIDPTQPDRIYAGLRGHGIYISVDGGVTWSAPESHFLGDLSTAVAVHPTDAQTVYVAHGQGYVSLTRDGGTTWRRGARLGVGGPQDQVTALAIRRDRPTTVFASNRTGVYRSSDSGQNWQSMSVGLSDRQIIALAIDARDPQRMFAGTGDSKPYFVYRGTGLYRTTDGASSWQHVPTIPAAPVPSISISAADPSVVYAAVMGHGVYRSVDGGVTWSNTGMLRNSYVYAVAAHPTKRDVVYTGTLQYYGKNSWDGSDGLFKSTDGGRTWQLLKSDWVENVVIDPARPDNVYFTEHSEKVWHSPDGGATWRLATKGLVAWGTHLYTYAMAIAETGGVLYMVNCGMGMYRNVLTAPER